MTEREEVEKKLREIEDKLFHDFSVLEKALKKYAKIAFENEDLIEKYSKNPAKALFEDNNLEIIKIIHNLEKAISENKLELEQKKSERSLMKIKDLDKEYFTTNKNDSKKIKENLDKIKTTHKLENKIILLEHADPGYDWIFTRNPSGLITKYGGVASHMSIRCSEIGLPAAIGCGEIIFEAINNASKVLLDCKNQQIIILKQEKMDEFMEEKKVLKSLGYIK